MTELVEHGKKVSADSFTHNTLTPLRLVRGLICLVIYISTVFKFLVYFVPALVVFLRLFQHALQSQRSSVLLWPLAQPMVVLVREGKQNNGGILWRDCPKRQACLAHRESQNRGGFDVFALRKGCLGSIKYVLMRSLLKLPIFGWGFHMFEFIPVERKWDNDEPILCEMLPTLTNRHDPLWLTVFPEGTDFTEEKCKMSQKFAAKNDLPILKNVLLPGTKGFNIFLETLRFSMDALYDLTIAYKN